MKFFYSVRGSYHFISARESYHFHFMLVFYLILKDTPLKTADTFLIMLIEHFMQDKTGKWLVFVEITERLVSVRGVYH